MAYGQALHQAVAAFHLRQIKHELMTADELVEVFRTHWQGEGFLSREHEEARFAAGEAALRRFHAANASLPAPRAVEQEFAFQLGVDRIRGRVDRVDATPEGDVITDYKSSDVRDPAKARQKARESLQLAIYALAEEARTGQLPAAVQLHFLESGVVGRAPLDEARLATAKERIAAAASGIRAGAFEPRPDYIACTYCPYRQICSASAAP
jgi:DNA helicase-2/ATP-dependent DNA helicase PcrA